MKMMDTAQSAADYLMNQERSALDMLKSTYQGLTGAATDTRDKVQDTVMDYIPTRQVIDPASLVIGLVVGLAVGAGVALYYREELLAAPAKAKKALADVQDALPESMNMGQVKERVKEAVK